MTAESKEEFKRTGPYRAVCVKRTALTSARLSSSGPAHRGLRPRAGPGNGRAFAQGSKIHCVRAVSPLERRPHTRALLLAPLLCTLPNGSSDIRFHSEQRSLSLSYPLF